MQPPHLSDSKNPTPCQLYNPWIPPQANKLCDRIVRELRCFSGEETRSRQREIMREYGVKFKANSKAKGEEKPVGQKSSLSTAAGEPQAAAAPAEPAPGEVISDTLEATEASFYAPTTTGNGIANHDI